MSGNVICPDSEMYIEIMEVRHKFVRVVCSHGDLQEGLGQMERGEERIIKERENR